MSHFGKTADGKDVQAFTITGKNGVEVKLLSRGATLAEWLVPDKNGKLADCVFGFDDVAGYESKGNGYFGATVGRVGNRIGDISAEPLAQSIVSFDADTLEVLDHWQDPTPLEDSDFGSSPTLFEDERGMTLVAAATLSRW